MIWLSAALAAPFVRTERIDLISEDPGTWALEDLPRLGYSPRSAALRWLEQVRFVAELPRFNVVLGASVASQSISYRFRITPRAKIYASAGLTTRLGLPRGVLLGAETWAGPVRLGLGLHLASDARWADPNWSQWRALPGIGIGLGRAPTVF